MQGWKQNLLLQAGREVLIKSVIQAIPAYAMACFAFPKKFCVRLNSYISNFWQGGDPLNRGIHWTSWTSLALTKSQGGMGLRDFHSFNLSLLAKQAWRLLKHPHSFCAKVLKGLYYPQLNFLSGMRGRRPSWSWASILQGRELLTKGLRQQVGNGKSILFWKDKWVPQPRNFQVLNPQPQDYHVQRVSEVINSNLPEWDSVKLRELVGSEEASTIATIPISSVNQDDCLVWHHTKTGNFEVRSGYQIVLRDSQSRSSYGASTSVQPPAKFWKLIWSLPVPPKV